MKRTLPITAFVACLALASSSMAQPPGGGRGAGGQGQRGPGGPGGSPLEHMVEMFDLADANQDGMLTKAELQAAIRQQGQGNRGRQGGPPPRDGQQPRGRGGDLGAGGPEGRGPEGRGPEGRGPEGRGLGGPGGPGGPAGELGAPPRPGQLLPAFVLDSLGVSDEQRAKLAALQQEVDKQLALILTAEQRQQLASHQPPPHGPGHEEGSTLGSPAGRPQRPQRPQ